MGPLHGLSHAAPVRPIATMRRDQSRFEGAPSPNLSLVDGKFMALSQVGVADGLG